MAYELPFEVEDPTFEGALETLHSALTFGIVPLLETVADMLLEAGRPDLSFTSVQVAGTNGKTSTARYTARILAGEGYKVALYTSPELVRYPERMEVDGRPVTDEAFAHGIAAATEAARRVNERRAQAGERPYDVTEFDTLTVAAAIIFAEAGVDVCVLEVGMGGRWDATSAFSNIEAVCVTGIGLDHMRILGDTVEEIAGEKAAVIRRGRACVLGPGTSLPHTVEDVFLARCEEEDVTPVVVTPTDIEDVRALVGPGEPRRHDELPRTEFSLAATSEASLTSLEVCVRTPRASYAALRALKPSYQAPNIACAVTLAEAYLGRALDEEALKESIAACPTPGRFDLVRKTPVGLVDACHNPQSVSAFVSTATSVFPERFSRPTLLCAVLADKDADGIVSLLAPVFERVVVTQTDSPRALAATELREIFARHGRDVEAVYTDVAEALELLRDVPFVAAGTITLAGEVAGLMRKES